MRAYAHDHHPIPLPAGHRFPAGKYALTREAVQRDLAGTVTIEPAPALQWDEIARVHDPDWVRRVRFGQLSDREQRALGLPWSPELVLRARHSAGATVAAALDALTHGVAANLGGGTHHAGRAWGRGYCLFNDAVLAIDAVRRADRARRVLVVDLDVHQGDGTADLIAADDEAFLLSVQGARNYPLQRVPADLDVELEDGTGDEAYLQALAPALEQAFERARPELVIYDAGADAWEHDRLGRLALTEAGMEARDALVIDRCRELGTPVATALGGGYGEPIDGTIRIHVRTLAAAARHSTA